VYEQLLKPEKEKRTVIKSTSSTYTTTKLSPESQKSWKTSFVKQAKDNQATSFDIATFLNVLLLLFLFFTCLKHRKMENTDNS
jgi:hypothetical protein